MAEIVNLRQARKRKRRVVEEKTAAAKRAAHGRPAAERNADRLAQDLARRRLEGHHREDTGGADPDGEA